jgi:hypothetical protein
MVASSITVPAGSNRATFPIKLANVSASTRVTVGAIYGGVTKTVSLTVTPQGPNKLYLAKIRKLFRISDNTFQFCFIPSIDNRTK